MIELLFSILITCFGLFCVAVGIDTFYEGYKARAKSDRIAEIETASVSNLQQGTVAIEGTVYPAEDAAMLESPIEGKDALAVHVTVDKWRGSSEGGGTWTTIHAEVRSMLMAVDNGTDKILVDLPSDGEVNVALNRTEVESGNEPPERIQQYLENEPHVETDPQHHLGPLTIGETRRYSEGVIEPGDSVCVVGTACMRRDSWDQQSSIIDESTESGEFILADKSKKKLIKEQKQKGFRQIISGGFITLAGALIAIIF